MKREVIRPALLRPPVFGLPLVSEFSGFDRVRLSREGWFKYRMAGDGGLYVFIAIVVSLRCRVPGAGCRVRCCTRHAAPGTRHHFLHSLEKLRGFLALFEPHVGFAPVTALADIAAHPFHLSAHIE